jgi:hypothetical protein
MIIFRATNDLFTAVRQDLHRAHPFAAERVGFIVCRAGRLMDGGLVILGAGYEAVADEDYLDDPTVGAMMGPAAIRKALQRAYNAGAEDCSIFHVHMHGHPGRVSAILMIGSAVSLYRISSMLRRTCRTGQSC